APSFLHCCPKPSGGTRHVPLHPPLPDRPRLAGFAGRALAEPLATPAAQQRPGGAGRLAVATARRLVRRLEETVARSSGPLILIGHSLGCVTIAHWAAQAAPALLARVGGALLVAPADVERAECPQPLRNFAPLPRQ